VAFAVSVVVDFDGDGDVEVDATVDEFSTERRQRSMRVTPGVAAMFRKMLRPSAGSSVQVHVAVAVKVHDVDHDHVKAHAIGIAPMSRASV